MFHNFYNNFPTIHDFLPLGNTGFEKAVLQLKEFKCRTRIVCGSGAVGVLRELGAKRILLVTDPYFEKNGTASRIGALSGAARVDIFSKIQPDPSVSLAAEGTARVNAGKPDVRSEERRVGKECRSRWSPYH